MYVWGIFAVLRWRRLYCAARLNSVSLRIRLQWILQERETGISGKAPHEGTRRILDLHGISYENMRARLVASEDFGRFEYFICMDKSNGENVRKIPGGEQSKLLFFMDLLPDEELREVPDPYFTGNFEQVYDLINAGCDVLLERIIQEKLQQA